jgi:hypothetical protein
LTLARKIERRREKERGGEEIGVNSTKREKEAKRDIEKE